MTISISADDFLSVCDKYPLARELLLHKATKRRTMFENYKSIILIKYMKAIRKNPHIMFQSATPGGTVK